MSNNEQSAVDPMARRAAMYRRVSTERQADEGWNYEEDGRKLRELADARGYELAEEYGDPGISGAREDRPGLQRMLADAEAGHFEVLLIPDIERLSRDHIAALGFVARLHAARVSIETFQGPMDLESPQGELHVNLDSAIAQFYRRQLGSKVSQAAKARAAKGKAPGGGYEPTGLRRGEDGHYIVHEPEAKIIRRIYREIREGYSQHRITHRLNANGLRTPNGKAWAQGTIGRILRNPVYRGAIGYKGEVVAEDAHEAIIEPEEWHEAQRVIAARDAPGVSRGRNPNGQHLLIGGMLRCTCGYAMRTRSAARGRPRATYECAGRRERGTEFCSQKPIPRALIDGAILEQFELIGLDIEATKREYAEATAYQLEQARDALAQAERAEQHAAEAVERVQRDYARGALSAESFEELRPQLVAEHEGARAEVERLRAHEHAIANATALGDAEEAVLRWLAELREVIAGKVRNAESVEALRNALTRLFSWFELQNDGSILPVLREDALLTLDPEAPPHMAMTGVRVPQQVTRSTT
jgi:site-specific DNA recombinase